MCWVLSIAQQSIRGNPSPQEGKARGSEAQAHPPLQHSEFKASLGFLRLSRKTKQRAGKMALGVKILAEQFLPCSWWLGSWNPSQGVKRELILKNCPMTSTCAMSHRCTCTTILKGKNGNEDPWESFLDAQGGQRGTGKSACKEGTDFIAPCPTEEQARPNRGVRPLGCTCSVVELRLEPHIPDAESQALQTLHCPHVN